MLLNFLKIAWRNMLHHKLHSLINIAGLTIGLASCMLIIAYVNHELSFDRFHEKSERIYDLHMDMKMMDNIVKVPAVSAATAPIIKNASNAVEGYMRLHKPRKGLIVEHFDGSKIAETNFLFADPGFFEFFSFRLWSGNPGRVLQQPFSLVISRDIADKYFNHQDPVGKTLRIKLDSAYYPFQITGVAENNPSNSTIRFDFVASIAGLQAIPEAAAMFDSQVMEAGDFKSYLLLRNAADTNNVRLAIHQLLKEIPDGADMAFPLVNLRNVHLESNLPGALNNKYFSLFPVVAALILVLALVNFMSLSTARSSIRAKEIGVRKASGASRLNIIRQFYTESALYVLPAFLLAYGFCYFSLPLFLQKLDIRIDPSFLFSRRELWSLLILLVATILLAGSYPSLVLSAFQPVVVLKGKLSKKKGGAFVFRSFTILQFTISIALIICGIIVRDQLHYIRSTDTGMNRDNVLMVPLGSKFGSLYNSFKNDVKQIPGIEKVATSRYPLYKGYDIFMSNNGNSDEMLTMTMFSIDTAFISLLDIKWKVAPLPGTSLISGNRVVINEVAAKKMGLPANPIGHLIYSNGKKFEVGGVVKDFNFSSMEYAVKPMCMSFIYDTATAWNAAGGCLYAKIQNKMALPLVIEAVKKAFQQYDQENLFTYAFADDNFDQQYKSEDRLSWLFGLCSSITLFLAIIGLFGLSTFAVEQRVREIGVRKVLGAGVLNLTLLLSRGFLILVLASSCLASVIGWWAMHHWLQNFSYRINIQWWMLAEAGFLVLVIAAITISYHTIRLALANPAKNLRTE